MDHDILYMNYNNLAFSSIFSYQQEKNAKQEQSCNFCEVLAVSHH